MAGTDRAVHRPAASTVQTPVTKQPATARAKRGIKEPGVRTVSVFVFFTDMVVILGIREQDCK